MHGQNQSLEILLNNIYLYNTKKLLNCESLETNDSHVSKKTQ